MANAVSEMTVITRAKELCSYIMTVTQKSPKQFRFTFVYYTGTVLLYLSPV